MNGKTVKSISIDQFLSALEEYKTAIETGTNIVGASIKVHSLKGTVPKYYQKMVNEAFKSTRHLTTV